MSPVPFAHDIPCRVCGHPFTRKVYDTADGPWYRCPVCACDSSATRYEDILPRYDAEYVSVHHGLSDWAAVLRSMTTNLEWFGKFDAPAHSFLDVGCCEGCALEGMMARGWTVAGFDINPAVAAPGVHIAPEFRADLFPHRFGAILCREVVEHVPNWQRLLAEIHAALLPGGLFQVQTPRPLWDGPHEVPYQWGHLQLFTPEVLRERLVWQGYAILESLVWDLGHAHICRKEQV